MVKSISMVPLPAMGYCFFFSSRRRHTRYWRDWSSDVCSSDLVVGTVVDASTSTSTRGCTGVRSDGEEGDDDHEPQGNPAPAYRPDGTPTPANPSYSLATPGAAPIGVPNFFIDKFRIPPFLLPI